MFSFSSFTAFNYLIQIDNFAAAFGRAQPARSVFDWQGPGFSTVVVGGEIVSVKGISQRVDDLAKDAWKLTESLIFHQRVDIDRDWKEAVKKENLNSSANGFSAIDSSPLILEAIVHNQSVRGENLTTFFCIALSFQ